jgi:hypothetical protein
MTAQISYAAGTSYWAMARITRDVPSKVPASM